MYTVLKWHSALWRQPRGWCGPWWKWVWHPCLKETHLQWCSNNFTAENKKRHFLFCFKDPLCHDDVHSQWTSRLSTDGKNISTMLFLSSFFYPYLRTCLLFLKRGEGRERDVKEKQLDLARDQMRNPGMCLTGNGTHNLLVYGWLSTNWAMPARAVPCISLSVVVPHWVNSYIISYHRGSLHRHCVYVSIFTRNFCL